MVVCHCGFKNFKHWGAALTASTANWHHYTYATQAKNWYNTTLYRSKKAVNSRTLESWFFLYNLPCLMQLMFKVFKITFISVFPAENVFCLQNSFALWVQCVYLLWDHNLFHWTVSASLQWYNPVWGKIYISWTYAIQSWNPQYTHSVLCFLSTACFQQFLLQYCTALPCPPFFF